MNGEQTGRRTIGLDDPRAVDILTTEHWSLLATRTLGYQEMFGRATIFIAIVSATVVALALLGQATDFSRQALSFAVLLIRSRSRSALRRSSGAWRSTTRMRAGSRE